jgi:hypothetical protein
MKHLYMLFLIGVVLPVLGETSAIAQRPQRLVPEITFVESDLQVDKVLVAGVRQQGQCTYPVFRVVVRNPSNGLERIVHYRYDPESCTVTVKRHSIQPKGLFPRRFARNITPLLMQTPDPRLPVEFRLPQSQPVRNVRPQLSTVSYLLSATPRRQPAALVCSWQYNGDSHAETNLTWGAGSPPDGGAAGGVHAHLYFDYCPTDFVRLQDRYMEFATYSNFNTSNEAESFGPSPSTNYTWHTGSADFTETSYTGGGGPYDSGHIETQNIGDTTGEAYCAFTITGFTLRVYDRVDSCG